MSLDAAADLELAPVSFCDVDLFSEWEIGLGWDIESTQLSAGANVIGFNHFALPGLLVAHFHSKRSMKNVFAVPDGMVVFVICRAKLPALWCGQDVPPTLLAVIRSARESWAVLPEAWDCYEFMVSEDLISRTEIFPPAFFAKTTQLERAFVPLMEPVTGQFLHGMDAVFQHGRGANGPTDGAVHRKRFFDFIIDGLQQVIDAGLRARGLQVPRAARRVDLVMKGRDFVFANLTNEISADDMAQALGVSYRVLNYAFRDTLGVSPYRYILTEKLHAVRRRLKSSSASITESCFSFGFQTPSRFTRQYARLFGELPSETTGRIRRLSE